jgi:hypothetical protein
MQSFVFTIVLAQRPTETELNKLIDNDVEDATFGLERGVSVVEFDRDASSLADAVASAIRDLEDAGMIPVRVVDEDLVTLADIADRLGQSRESVRRYAMGSRGPGGFPPPVNPARDGTVFYRWSEVAPWMRDRLGIQVTDAENALVMANLVLQARQLAGRVIGARQLIDLLHGIRQRTV